MEQPAAKAGDQIKAVDNHVVLVPAPDGVQPEDQQPPFNGIIDNNLCTTVLIQGKAAAVIGSTATNTPIHVPIGGNFEVEPTNQGQIISGSVTVLLGGRGAARAGDRALTCNDPVPAPVGTVVAESSVLIGD